MLTLCGLACALFGFGQVGNGQPLQQSGQLGRDVIALRCERGDVGAAGLHGDATDTVDLNLRAAHHRAASTAPHVFVTQAQRLAFEQFEFQRGGCGVQSHAHIAQRL